jgi:formylglycine-generating enzyme required for sulfatase activity
MQTRQIFLASSSELLEDRKEFELLISRKNKELVKQGVFLELVIWEDFLDVMSQERLQEEYNQAIRECDLFVMLCFTKVGKFTQEEFEVAFGQFQVDSKPRILTYFKDAAITTGSANEDDLMSLFAFKRKLKDLGHFSTSYPNIDALKHHFTGQLDKLATAGFFQPKPNAGSILTKEAKPHPLRPYLQWLQARTRSIELRGLTQGLVELPLETAYVPLRARALPHHGEGRMARGSRVEHEAEFAEREADVALDQVLGLGNRLAIVGGPGSGKTTVLLHMAWALATSLLSGEAEPARSRLGLTLAASDLPLPIFVPLAAFARYRRCLAAAAPARERTLARFISHHLISRQADFDLPEDFLAHLLEDGGTVILLLDGLDEVANEAERAEVRQSVEDLVYGREALRVVVSCRTIVYRSGGTTLAASFREISVQPLDHEQHIAPMVRHAYACIYSQDVRLQRNRSEDLLRGIEQLEQERRARLGDDVPALVGSPLMVRLLLIIHVNDSELPDERAALFDKAVEALLKVDYTSDQGDRSVLAKDWQSFRDLGTQLAFHMHQQGLDQGREIDERALKAALAKEDPSAVEDFICHVRDRGSLLEERDGVYRFIHLAFQEHLVARYLAEIIGGKSRADLIAFLSSRLEDPWWREPILLLAGHQARTAAVARDFLTELSQAGATPNARFSAVELAAAAALEWRLSGEAVRTQCAQRIAQLLATPQALQQSQPVRRARAADRLALLGDPRFDPQHWHLPADEMLGFVRIAADPHFSIGTRQCDVKRIEEVIDGEVTEDEINDALTPTPEFYIARYPVTVAQFAAFVEAAKFDLENADALRDLPTRPVRWVNWHDALAYCEWLNGMLAVALTLAKHPLARLRERDWSVSLPSELEWEVAARGGLRDQTYSWEGDSDPNQANYEDSGIKDTSAVGCFAANGFGLCDMIGNVWEWTRSVYASYPYDPKEKKREDLKAHQGNKVLRGGAFGLGRDGAHCACRYWISPSNRFDSIGFRVVLRGPAVP